MSRKILIGSRGSKLALAQSEYVKKLLQEKYDYDFEIKVITTSGDKDLVSNWENSDKSLKSFFVKEIEQELLEGKIDIAVHSMKDVPSENPKGLICGAVPKREDARDVLITRENILFANLKNGAVIGTSSMRRNMNLKNVRKDLNIKHLRGNIHTRIQKLNDGEYDGIILAAAGLKRVNLQNLITEYLNENIFLPAPAQGALYIQCRENDEFIKDMLKSINDEKTEKVVFIEREFSKIFDGGCHTPMGCLAKIKDEKIIFRGILYKNDKAYTVFLEEDVKNIDKIASKAADIIKEKIDEK